jgi:hypothetical protein
MPRKKIAFCDFCKCVNCRDGASWLSHAKTSDGRWICDVCYTYDVCVRAKRKAGGRQDGPCDDMNCEHRPRLVSAWERFEEEKR